MCTSGTLLGIVTQMLHWLRTAFIRHRFWTFDCEEKWNGNTFYGTGKTKGYLVDVKSDGVVWSSLQAVCHFQVVFQQHMAEGLSNFLLQQEKENKIVIKLWRRNFHFSRTQKLRDVGALNSKNNDAQAKDDDVVMEAFVIVLNGERHPEIKVFCPRTLHNARSGLAPRPYDLDCSALTDVHCVFQKCH